jgi:hypothetical protein
MGLNFSQLKFCLVLVRSVAQACIIFFLPFYVLDSTSIAGGSKGYPTEQWTMSLSIYYSVFIVVTLNLIINMRAFTFYHLLAILGMSILPLFAIILVSDFKSTSWMYLVIRTAHTQPLFYLTVLCVVSICAIMDYLSYLKDFLYKPDPSYFLQLIIPSGKAMTDPQVSAQWLELLEAQQRERVNRQKIHEAMLNKKRQQKEALLLKKLQSIPSQPETAAPTMEVENIPER